MRHERYNKGMKKEKDHRRSKSLSFLSSSYFSGDWVVIASPAGGPVPIDSGSLADPYFTDAAKKFMHDAAAIGALCHSVKLDTLSLPGDFDAIYLPGKFPNEK